MNPLCQHHLTEDRRGFATTLSESIGCNPDEVYLLLSRAPRENVRRTSDVKVNVRNDRKNFGQQLMALKNYFLPNHSLGIGKSAYRFLGRLEYGPSVVAPTPHEIKKIVDFYSNTNKIFVGRHPEFSFEWRLASTEVGRGVQS